jgi:hypothetical protein
MNVLFPISACHVQTCAHRRSFELPEPVALIADNLDDPETMA